MVLGLPPRTRTQPLSAKLAALFVYGPAMHFMCPPFVMWLQVVIIERLDGLLDARPGKPHSLAGFGPRVAVDIISSKALLS